LEAFDAKLREETDLERISEELVLLIKETMQPINAALSLCSLESGRREIEKEESRKIQVLRVALPVAFRIRLLH
jgi:G:T/U-mismatch repair DNA glycosylase